MRKTITIGDLGTIITGKTPPTTNKNYYGDYAVFIKPTDISEQSKYTYETEEMYSKFAAEKYESSLIPKGAICVPCIGTIGTKMTMAPCDCYTNQSINSIVCNENYDNEYVYYLIKNFLPGLKAYNLGTASGREYVSKSNFEKIELVAEQDKTIQKRIGVILSRYDSLIENYQKQIKCIATILSRYDSLIENYQKQIKLLEEAAQRLYKEWFVDLHFPGHENTKIVDGVPEGWEKKKVTDILDVKYGKDHKQLEAGNIPVYGTGGIMRYTDRSLYSGESVLIPRKGSLNNIMFVDETFWTIDTMFYSIPKIENAAKIVYFYLKGLDMYSLNIGAAVPSMTISILSGLDIQLPPNEIRLSFEGFMNKYFEEIKNYFSQIRLLTEARDRLLPKLMSGEIAV